MCARSGAFLVIAAVSECEMDFFFGGKGSGAGYRVRIVREMRRLIL